ncbi:MAG: DUF3237 domain-containing protein [Curtobacterium sp.]
MLDSVVAPALTHLASIAVEVAPPIDLGAGDGEHRRIVPILGGRVEGPRFSGRVLPGGADFQVLRSPTLTVLEARYAIETDDGERIYVENFGLRSGSVEDIARVVAGQPVDPDRIYFRSNPRLSSAAPRWSWLASRLFIARGVRLPDRVGLEVFLVE